jgi:hypothetical protein
MSDDPKMQNPSATQPEASGVNRQSPLSPLPPLPEDSASPADANDMAEPVEERITRLAGEPAPDISPEEFARLQSLGSVNMDSRGRIFANRREEDDPGVSLRKRRAWYA